MIKVNGIEIKVEHYPDGTQKINLLDELFDWDLDENGEGDGTSKEEQCIEWTYENDAELFTLIAVKKHIDYVVPDSVVHLFMYYVPNARMDRTHNDEEVFTLKYFCQIINDLQFDRVFILDSHSNVTTALLDRCEPLTTLVDYLATCLYCTIKLRNNIFSDDGLVFYYPDLGALKRYYNEDNKFPVIYGEKKRDWNTGKILGLEIKNPANIPLEGKTVLMIDDIISYGGSLYYSALKLKELGVGEIYAYATHTENSILDKEKGTLIKLLEDGTVERLFTTNSIFNKEHDRINVLDLGEVMKLGE